MQASYSQNIGYYIKDLGIGFGVFKKMDVQSNDLVLSQAGLPVAGGELGAVGHLTQMPP